MIKFTYLEVAIMLVCYIIMTLLFFNNIVIPKLNKWLKKKIKELETK